MKNMKKIVATGRRSAIVKLRIESGDDYKKLFKSLAKKIFISAKQNISTGFMKQKFSFWFIIGIGIGTALGIAFNNMSAGMCLGIGSSAIVTLLVNDYDNEH